MSHGKRRTVPQEDLMFVDASIRWDLQTHRDVYGNVYYDLDWYSYYALNNNKNNFFKKLNILREDIDNTIYDINQEFEKNNGEMKLEIEKKYNEFQSQLKQKEKLNKKQLQDMMGRYQKDINDLFTKQRDSFKRDYETKVRNQLDSLIANLKQTAQQSMKDINALQADAQAKEAKKQALAKKYIEKAKELLQEYENNIFDKRYVDSFVLKTLKDNLNQSIDNFNEGVYEASLASSIACINETSIAVCEANENQMKYSSLNAQAAYEVDSLLKRLEEEKIYHYDSDKDPKILKNFDGKDLNEFSPDSKIQKLYDQLTNIKECLKNKEYTLKDLEDMTETTIPQLQLQLSDSILEAMRYRGNAVQRYKMSKAIVKRFKENAYSYQGQRYGSVEGTGNDKLQTLYLLFVNNMNGEEVVVALHSIKNENGSLDINIDTHKMKGKEENTAHVDILNTAIEDVYGQGHKKGQDDLTSAKFNELAHDRNALNAYDLLKRKVKA